MSIFSKAFLESAELALKLLTNLVIIALVAYAVLFTPSLVKGIKASLEEAGVTLEEFTVFGAKLKFSQEALQRADGRITELAGLVKCLQSGTCNELQTEQARTFAAAGDPVAPIDEVLQAINRAVRESEAALQLQMEVRQVEAAPQKWVVVAGSDSTLDGAQFESRRLAAFNPIIVRRGDWYATTIQFDTRAAAREAVPNIAAITGREPFVRQSSEWCPAPTPGPQGTLICSFS